MGALRLMVVGVLYVFALSGVAHAAVLQHYSVRAEGAFSEMRYSGLFSFNHADGAFQSLSNVRFLDPYATALTAHETASSLRAGVGTAELSFDASINPAFGNAVITNCTGFLSFLCAGGTQIFDAASQSLTSFSTNSWMTTLTRNELVHRSDSPANWQSGTTSFFSSGGSQVIEFDLTSLEIELAAVPLPAGWALLLGGMFVFAGLRRQK